MRHIIALLLLAMTVAGAAGSVSAAPEKEFLTPKEIEKIQDAQEIDLRMKIYMAAATLRLKTAEDRLIGNEPVAGDPMEFFTPEDLVDAYYRIIKSVMFNMDDAFQKPGADRGRLGKALNTLKSGTETAGKQLEILKKTAEDKKKEELWNAVNKAIDITNGAHEGAEYGLSKQPAPSEKKKKSR